MEKLLETTARNIINTQKINYPTDYNHLIDIADNPYNITIQVRQIILGTDPSRKDTLLQDIAARDLERLHLDNFNDIIKFSQSYITVAANKGRLLSGP